MARVGAIKRGRLSLTSLIDVIFLLLLFFMLSSSFSKFGEIELRTAGGAARPDFGDAPIVFARLGAQGLSINGRAVPEGGLAGALTPLRRDGTLNVMLAVTEEAKAQGLADALRQFEGLRDLRVAVLD